MLVCTIYCITSYNSYAQPAFKNANDIQIHMRQNFIYQVDRIPYGYFEYFQIPAMLEFSRMGDCDDLSLYSYYYLEQLGYEATQFLLWINNEEEIVGHAITVFLDDDETYSIFSNRIILKTKETNAILAIVDVYPDWLVICLWTPKHFGLVRLEQFKEDVKLVVAKNVSSYISYLKLRIKNENYF